MTTSQFIEDRCLSKSALQKKVRNEVKLRNLESWFCVVTSDGVSLRLDISREFVLVDSADVPAKQKSRMAKRQRLSVKKSGIIPCKQDFLELTIDSDQLAYPRS